jgi:hypothetical protein
MLPAPARIQPILVTVSPMYVGVSAGTMFYLTQIRPLCMLV